MHTNKFNNVIFIFIFLLLPLVCFAQIDTKTNSGNGIGSGSGATEKNNPQKTNPNNEGIVKLRILSKPKANYTDVAKKNGIEGVVRLRVTFLASGEIGTITPIIALPFGLTEQANEAALKLKFQPASRNNVPYPVTAAVEYAFYIYHNENDEDLEKNAEILEMPNPEFPNLAGFNELGGTVRLMIMLKFDGDITVNKIESDLPIEFQNEAIKAVSKIKFKPAIHKNGNKASQGKEIKYEFNPQKD